LANPELGAKQICPNCQSKFYDLGRRPAVCPKCGESFDPEEALKSRRVRARASTPDYDAEDEKPVNAAKEEPDGFEDEVDETPEIDVVEPDVLETDDEDADPGTPTPAGGDDLGVDFAEDEDLAEDEADDVPFLEDEDEDVLDDEIEGLPGADDDDR